MPTDPSTAASRRRPTRRELLALAAGTAAGAATGAALGGAGPADAAVARAASSDAAPTSADGRVTTWVTTWAAAPTTVARRGAPLVLERQTVRHVVHCSVGGDELRVRLTNEFGDTPLRIGGVRVALRDGTGASSAIVAATDRRVTFGGRPNATVPAGAPLVSDPVRLRLPAGGDLAISIYFPDRTPVTTHAAYAYQDNVIANGDVTGARTVTPVETRQEDLFLSGVAVRGRGTGAIVALGDSITNGANTVANLDHRWPDLLAARLRQAHLDLGVANLGVSGNRLLHDPNPPAGSDAETFADNFGVSGLRRFDRDVLAQPGRRFLIVLLGVNDLGHPGTVAPPSEVVGADDLIAGHRQLIARAHEAGVRAFGGTVLPFKDDTLGFCTPVNEAKRQQLNHWIRTSGEYDGVVDFDRVMGAPGDPTRLNPALDSGDHLHPNDDGMAVMAAAVPLRWFR
ncbi:SGNH/GDSL hydrolase family protein [Paractinoplanes ferrugineus]|uniref:SGNH/GDSL hydrolase family protein n=1 Tax=Paractinoplanes ferrugineus TaxID=113564 RepID=UPI001EF1EAF0|nr:SGNH/GDSL hydrolase family protein [Actinoplanes ferrugineus]